MAVQFPQNPSPGDQFIASNGNIYVFSESKWLGAVPDPNYEDIQGATGATGPPGPAETIGSTGPIGVTGASGATGATGEKGAKGNVGSSGADSIVPGPQGASGATGAQGASGATGPTGADSVVAGPQGASGATGPQGIQGNTIIGGSGATGDEGPQGASGATGPAGADSVVAGPQGASGATGPAGPGTSVPPIVSISVSDSPEADRFKDATFRVDLAEVNGGIGPLSYKLKAQVSGEFYVFPETSAISSVSVDSNLPVFSSQTKVTGSTNQFNFSWNGISNANAMPSGFFSDPEAFTSNSTYDVNGAQGVGAIYTSGNFRLGIGRFTYTNATVGDYIFLRLSTSNAYEMYNDGWTISGSAVFDDAWNVSSSPSTIWYRDQSTWDPGDSNRFAFIRVRLTATSGTFDFGGKSQLAGYGSGTGIMGANGTGTSESVYTVTFPNSDGLSNIKTGTRVLTVSGTKSGVIDEINTTNNTAVIRGLSGGALVVGDKLTVDTGVLASNVTRYCVMNADGDVSTLSNIDPGYQTFNGYTPYYIKFPSSLYGKNTDTILPAGVSLDAFGEITGGAGVATGSRSVTPL